MCPIQALFGVKKFQNFMKLKITSWSLKILSSFPFPVCRRCPMWWHPSFLFLFHWYSIGRKFYGTRIGVYLMKTRFSAPREPLTLKNPMRSCYGRGNMNEKRSPSCPWCLVTSEKRSITATLSIPFFSSQVQKSHSEPSLCCLPSVISLRIQVHSSCKVRYLLCKVPGVWRCPEHEEALTWLKDRRKQTGVCSHLGILTANRNTTS